MRRSLLEAARRQDGFTLVEMLVALSISVIVMTALTSVVLTSWRAWTTASGRVEASAQVRSFEFTADDDFAQSSPPTLPAGCGTSAATPCTTQPLVLLGTRAANTTNPVVTFNNRVAYVWDGTSTLDRIVGGNAPVHAATEVTAFSWYVQGAGQHQTVTVTLTVTEQGYSETQTLQFHPQLG